MMQSRFRLLATFLIAALLTSAKAGDYKKIKENGVLYHAYIAKPSELRIHWKDVEGKPFRKLDALDAALKKQNRDVHFLGNAGIFMEGGMPLGIHVEAGKQLRGPNQVKEAYGNFYLQPNGIFFIEGDSAKVVTTDAYLKGTHTPRLATQSGPMLLIDGKKHPKFNKDSPNRFYRNGVGILPDGRVILIITDHAFFNTVNLYGFAEVFAKQGCKNALFLDGGLSAVRIPDAKIRVETGGALGPLLSVSTPKPQTGE